jgi:hypothetical protein
MLYPVSAISTAAHIADDAALMALFVEAGKQEH